MGPQPGLITGHSGLTLSATFTLRIVSPLSQVQPMKINTAFKLGWCLLIIVGLLPWRAWVYIIMGGDPLNKM